jgi:NAD(P)-dependent dehydrogenase (short-subunit alcohol dehydrogenase family)
MKSLANKIVALTGAASGIGRSLAVQLAERGCHLALADVDMSGLQATQAMLPKTIKVTTHQVDVANRERVYQWAEEVASAHGGVDVLINNAGVVTRCSIDDISYEDFDWVFDIVFYGVLYGCKAFLPHLRRRPEGHIVNISSVNGFFPFPENGPYNCAKHAVKALSQTLMQELRDSPIQVTSVHPGGIKTNIVRSGRFIKSKDPGATSESATAEFDRIARTSPEKAASVIIQGILADKKRVLIGVDAHIIDILVRLFPQGFSNFIGRSSARRVTPTVSNDGRS